MKIILVNPPANFENNLDDIPFPARHLLPNHLYRYALCPGKKVMTMITSQGSPCHCIFCEKSIFGSRWRARSPLRVLDEMGEVVKGALSGRRAAGKFRQEYSCWQLLRILVKAYISVIQGLPKIWKKRKEMKKLTRVSKEEIREWFARFGISGREIALKE